MARPQEDEPTPGPDLPPVLRQSPFRSPSIAAAPDSDLLAALMGALGQRTASPFRSPSIASAPTEAPDFLASLDNAMGLLDLGPTARANRRARALAGEVVDREVDPISDLLANLIPASTPEQRNRNREAAAMSLQVTPIGGAIKGRPLQASSPDAAKVIGLNKPSTAAKIERIKNANYDARGMLVDGPPKTKSETTRLYRGERGLPTEVDPATTGRWFTDDYAKASKYGPVKYVDVPTEVVDRYRTGVRGEFVLTPPNYAGRMRLSDADVSLMPGAARVDYAALAKPIGLSKAESSLVNIGENVAKVGPPLRDIPPATTGGGGNLPLYGRQVGKFDEAVQPLIQENVLRNEASYAARSAPITHDATILAAQESGRPVREVAAELAKRGELSQKIIEVQNGVSRALEPVLAVASKPADQRTPREILDAMFSFREASAIQGSLFEAASEYGRGLNALKIEINRDLARQGSEAGIRAAINRVAKSPEKADALFDAVLMFKDDPAKLYRLLRDSRRSSFLDRLFTDIRANALWNPNTTETNMTSGALQSALFLADRAIQRPSAALPMFKAFVGGLRGAVDDIAKDLVSPSKYSDASDLTQGLIPGPIGRAQRFSFKIMSTQDAFQTRPMFNAALRFEAEIAADQVAKEAAGRVFDRAGFIKKFIEDPPTAAMQKAYRDSEQMALHEQGPLVSRLNDLARNFPLARMGMLFVTAPVNVGKVGARYSPLGLLRPLTERMGFTHGAPLTPMSQVLRESAAIGGPITGFFWMLQQNGDMTGLAPRSKSERDQWAADGRPPLSIRASEYPLWGPIFRAAMGEKAQTSWVGMNMLGPLMIPAMVAAAAHTIGEDSVEMDPMERTAIASMAVGRSLIETIPTYQGVRGLNAAFNSVDPGSVATNLVGGLARLAIPFSTLIGTVERMSDDFRRSPKNLIESVMSVVPILAKSVNPAQDVLGRDVPNENSGFGALLPRVTSERDHPVIQEGLRLEKAVEGFVGLTKMSDTIGQGKNAIKLDSKDFYDYQRIVGKNLEGAMAALINSPDYQNLRTDEQKAKRFAAAKGFAVEAGRADFAVSRVNAPGTSTEDVAKWAGVALSGSRGHQADAVVRLSLTEDSVRLINASRDPDDPTVAELIRGKVLIGDYLKSPPFVIGNPNEWTEAKRQAELYRTILDSYPSKNGALSPEALRFWTDESSLMLRRYYETGGDLRSAVVGPVRRSLKKEQLWEAFGDAARSRDPYYPKKPKTS